MTRPGLRRALTALLAVWTFLPMVIGSPTVQAASARQTAPPGINAAQPTVSGRLVAKATNGTTTGAAVCGRTTAAPTRMINRGLVICTSQGNLVLLQLSRSTGIFNRDWQRLAYARLALGDQINAWGALGAGGALLNPTVAIQDLSKSSPRL